MRKFSTALVVLVVFNVLFAAGSSPVRAQQRSERQTRDLIRSLNSRIDDFRFSLDSATGNGDLDRQTAADLRQRLTVLSDKIGAFDDNLSRSRENRDDVRNIETASREVDYRLQQARLADNKLRSDWSGIRDQINQLSSLYGANQVSAPRSAAANRPIDSSIDSAGLTGTYSIDRSRSEDASRIVAEKNVGSARQTELENKLDAPEQIAIDIRGTRVTLASSKAAPVSLIADGTEKIDDSGGRTVRLKATLRGQQLLISSLGGETDFTVSFTPDGAGGLKVTRRITTDYLPETLIVDSFYTRTETVARLGIDQMPDNAAGDNGGYSSNDPADSSRNGGRLPTLSQGRIGEYIVSGNTILTALLDNSIDTKISQNNDRFKLVVQSPDEFRGAVIEGYLSGVGRSGQVSGRSNVTFNFDRIILRNGRSYDFAGTLQSIKDQYGKVVRVDNEGTAKGESQTKETAKRGGIGAGLGAVIGAIAGGGKGAAIGAIIGGGAGAGSVIVQGRDDIQLMKGSTFTIQSSSPNLSTQPVSEN